MTAAARAAVGVFDSGVGGVSALRDMARLMPGERFLYYGDNRNAPYGTRPEREILNLALDAADFLVQKGVKALVVACNTATSAAIVALRGRYDMPVVGMEPALKPAALLRDRGKVLVLATPATLRQEKFHHLYELYGEGAEVLPCPGLMEFAERGELGGPALDQALESLLSPYRGQRLDAAVLGCTHYVFLRRAIGRTLPGVPLIDGNAGTAHRLHALLTQGGLLSNAREGSVTFLTSGDENVYIPMMKRLFSLPIED
ncbi:MAG: glutamate racemase [Clostridiales bacterium]|nr:glutamate racemase [Clostridiales bacterium]